MRANTLQTNSYNKQQGGTKAAHNIHENITQDAQNAPHRGASALTV